MTDHQGVLFKKGAVRWNLRYFTLSDDVLRYWDNMDQAQKNDFVANPKGGLRVTGVQKVDSNNSDKFFFDVFGESARLHVFTHSELDRSEWLRKLEAAVDTSKRKAAGVKPTMGSESSVRQMERRLSGLSGLSGLDDASSVQSTPMVPELGPSLSRAIADPESPLVRGDVTVAVPPTNSTLVLYISGTFEDMDTERHTLVQKAFPRIREVCGSYGVDFQPIDLRWDAAAAFDNHHGFLETCLNELERSKRESVGINFATFLSQKYGYRTFPAVIPAAEFQKLLGAVKAKDDKQLVSECFQLNTNIDPHVYELRPLKQLSEMEFTHKELRGHPEWWALHRILQNTLRAASQQVEMGEGRAALYYASLQHLEIQGGVERAKNAWEGAFWFRRNFKDVPINHMRERRGESAGLVDEFEVSVPDRAAVALLQELKEQALPERLGVQFISFPEPWDGRKAVIQYTIPYSPAGVTHAVPQHQDYLDRLCEDLEKVVAHSLTVANPPRPSPALAMNEELAYHHALARYHLQHFHGRQDSLQAVQEYLSLPQERPLVVGGTSGSGKSALLAKAAEMAKGKYARIVRFLGGTPLCNSLPQVIASVSAQIAALFPNRPNLPTVSAHDNRTLATGLHACLSVATEAQPLLLVLDGLDSLPSTSPFEWLPLSLPPHTHVILSYSSDTNPACVAALASLGLTGGKSCESLEVGDLAPSDVEAIVAGWLRARSPRPLLGTDIARRLSKGQRQALENGAKACPSPLYLALAFEVAKTWKSWDEVDAIPPSVDGILGHHVDLLEGRFHPALVRKALSYLAASEFGLTSSELEDLLSLDDEVLNALYPHEPPHSRRVSPMTLCSLVEAIRPLLVPSPSPCPLPLVHHRPLLSFSHPVVQRFVENRYLGGPYSQSHEWLGVHGVMADFFNGVWSRRPKPYERVGRGGQVVSASEMRGVAEQPTFFVDVGGRVPNVRKLSELPYHLLRSRQLSRFKTDVLTMEAIAAKVMSGGLDDLQHMLLTALEQSRATDQELFNMIREWRRFLSRHAHVLHRHPTVLLQQALNEPNTSAFRNRAESVMQSEQMPFVECVNKPDELSACVHTFTGHSAWVSSVGVSNGLVLSSSLDGTLRLWDEKSGLERHCLPYNDNTRVSCSAMDKSGAIAVSGAVDRKMAVWDLATPQLTAVFAEHTGQIQCCALTPDAQYAVSGDVNDDNTTGNVLLWSVSDLKLMWSLEMPSSPKTLCFSPTTPGLVIGCASGLVAVYKYDPFKLPKKPHKAIESGSGVHAAAFAPDGKTFVTGHGVGTAIVWAIDGSKKLVLQHSARLGNDFVTCVAYSSDGKRIATGGRDKIAKVWDATTGDLLCTFRGHEYWLVSVAFGEKDEMLITGSRDFTLKMWEIEGTRKAQMALEADASPLRHTKSITCCCVSPDGAYAATGSADRTVIVWDTDSGAALHLLKGHANWVEDVAFSPDSRLLVSVSDDHTVRVWNVATGQLVNTLSGHTHEVNCCAFSGRGLDLLTASKDGQLILWNVHDSRQQWSTHHSASVECVAFVTEPNVIGKGNAGDHFVSGDSDGVLSVWLAASQQCEARVKGHDAPINSVALSERSQLLVSGSDDKTVRVWTVSRVGDRLTPSRVFHHNHGVTGCAFVQPGYVVSVAGGFWNEGDDEVTDVGDSTLRVWDGKSNSEPSLLFCADAALFCVAAGKAPVVVAGCKKGRMYLLRPSFADLDGLMVEGLAKSKSKVVQF